MRGYEDVGRFPSDYQLRLSPYSGDVPEDRQEQWLPLSGFQPRMSAEFR